jgi:hypothetical protein
MLIPELLGDLSQPKPAATLTHPFEVIFHRLDIPH